MLFVFDFRIYTIMKSIWKLGLIIALTRLITLSMPFVDTVMLGRYGAKQLAIFVIGNQLPQLLTVMAMGLLVGINVIVPKEQNDLTQIVTSSLIFAFAISIIVIIILLSSNGIYSLNTEITTKNILCAGIPFVIFSYAIASVLESCGYERLMLVISIFFALLNPIFNYILLNTKILSITEAAYSVAISTSIIRVLMLFIAVFVLFKVTNVKINRNNICTAKHIKDLLHLGLPESLSRSLFAGSIVALSFYIANVYSVNDVAIFGIALSIINTLLVFFLGTVISLTINLSKMKTDINLDVRSALTVSIKSLMPVYVIFISLMIYSRHFMAYLYVGNNQFLYSAVVAVIPFCIAVIVIDAASSSMVSILRVYGDKKIPSFMKIISFVCVGIPISLVYSNENAVIGILTGFITGSNLALILLIIRFNYFSSINLRSQ